MCMQSYLKTLPDLLSIWNHMSFPFFTISALAGFGCLPNCYCCQKSKTSARWFIWCLNSSGTRQRRGGGTQNPKYRGVLSRPSRLPPQQKPPMQGRSSLRAAPLRARAAVPTDSSSKCSFTYIFFVRVTGANRHNRAKLYFHPGKALPHRCRLSLVYMMLAHPKS